LKIRFGHIEALEFVKGYLLPSPLFSGSGKDLVLLFDSGHFFPHFLFPFFSLHNFLLFSISLLVPNVGKLGFLFNFKERLLKSLIDEHIENGLHFLVIVK
jgi:hypothetical protein